MVFTERSGKVTLGSVDGYRLHTLEKEILLNI